MIFHPLAVLMSRHVDTYVKA